MQNKYSIPNSVLKRRSGYGFPELIVVVLVASIFTTASLPWIARIFQIHNELQSAAIFEMHATDVADAIQLDLDMATSITLSNSSLSVETISGERIAWAHVDEMMERVFESSTVPPTAATRRFRLPADTQVQFESVENEANLYRLTFIDSSAARSIAYVPAEIANEARSYYTYILSRPQTMITAVGPPEETQPKQPQPVPNSVEVSEEAK